MLWLKGANTVAGGLNAPEKSAELSSAGWLRTGDVARFDEDGFLFIERPSHASGKSARSMARAAGDVVGAT
jgi:non-ribosomal peptide synthetase component E (peptide arylation enzyme)